MTGPVAPRPEEVMLRRLYEAYNGRDANTLVTFLTLGVDWPDGPRRLRGHAAVRGYWAEQWRRIHTYDHVTAITPQPDGSWLVAIDQTVRTPDDATVVSTGRFEHRYRFTDGLVARMDITRL